MRGGAHQSAVERARADEVIEHLRANLTGIEHIRSLSEQAGAVSLGELRGRQAHVAAEADAQLGDGLAREIGEHARERTADPLGDRAVDLLAVETANVVGLEDVGCGGAGHVRAILRVACGGLIGRFPETRFPRCARTWGVRIRRLAYMSGHSKWASIKHKKAIVDSRRGAQFTKLARSITVAARDGGGDPVGNPALELAIRKAKESSMPKENIERAIAKGTGEGGEAEAIEAVLYEGYGPGGVAVLVEALTDNRNRTGADVRHAFSKHGGNLGEPGSVAYLFEKKGTIVIDSERYSEDDLMAAVEAGADDIVADEGSFEVLAEPASFSSVIGALSEAGVETESAEMSYRPTSLVPIDESQVRKLIGLTDALEELDDVDNVNANFDVPADVLERVAG